MNKPQIGDLITKESILVVLEYTKGWVQEYEEGDLVPDDLLEACNHLFCFVDEHC